MMYNIYAYVYGYMDMTYEKVFRFEPVGPKFNIPDLTRFGLTGKSHPPHTVVYIYSTFL